MIYFNVDYCFSIPFTQIVVNGAHFMEYKHRISASSVGNIFVNGGVEIQSIAFQNPAVSILIGI